MIIDFEVPEQPLGGSGNRLGLALDGRGRYSLRATAVQPVPSRYCFKLVPVMCDSSRVRADRSSDALEVLVRVCGQNDIRGCVPKIKTQLPTLNMSAFWSKADMPNPRGDVRE